MDKRDNLIPFVKGQSGNPNGRPRGTENSKKRLWRLLSLTQNIKNPVTKEVEGFTVLEQMDMAIIQKALKGDVNAYNEIEKRLGFEDDDERMGANNIQLILLRDAIIPKHYEHFNKGFDWTISMGGSRSGKTYNFLLWALLQTFLGKFDLSIIAPSHKTLELGAFADVRHIFAKYVPDVHIPERPTKIDVNGSRWQFEVVTSENEAKRNRGNVFINEADGVPVEVANIIGRASGRKFIDFNPVRKFWAHKYVQEDNQNLLVSYWKDNPHLTSNQLQWFEDLRTFGENAEVGSPERYAYDVYYLGDYSLMGGKAFDIADFNILDTAPQCDYYLTYSDPSLGDGGDYFATLLFGIDIKKKEVYAIDCIFSQYVKVSGFVEQLRKWDKLYTIDHYSESNGMSNIPTKASNEMYEGILTPINNTDNKRGDIMVYAPFAKRVKFVRSNNMMQFINQCCDFPSGQHDDAPDCLCRGIKIIKKYYDI